MKLRNRYSWFRSGQRTQLTQLGVGALLLSGAGCSSEVPEEKLAHSTAALVAEDGLSFENASGWSVFAGSADLVDAGSALRLSNINGYVEVRNTVAVGSFQSTNTAQITVNMPDVPWGWASLYFDIPSRGIYRQYVGPIDLGSLPAGTNKLSFSIPQHVLTALGQTYADFRIGIAFAVPTGTTLDLTDIALDSCGQDPSQNRCQKWTGRDMLGLRNVGWGGFRNLTRTELAAHVADARANGGIPLSLGSEPSASGDDYTITVRENVDQRAWQAHWDLTSEEYNDLWQEYSDDGLRPLDIEAYQVDGQVRFAGIWVENKENLAWFSYRGFTSEEYAEHFEEYTALNYRPIDIEVYPTGAGERIATVWYQNVDNVPWTQLRDMTPAEYQEKADELVGDGYITIDVESYQGGSRYAAIWEKPAFRPAFQVRTGRRDPEFANLARQYYDEGYRPLSIESFGDDVFGGIWLANDDRLSYAEKDDIDAAIQSYQTAESVPGLSVVLMRGGRIVYQRGFGFADVAGNKVAHGNTVYTAASVSKVFGGTLAVKLEDESALEDGTPVNLDLTNTTDTYLTGLPAHHTHTVEQLTSHLGCVVHYNTVPQGDDPTNHYATAADAAADLWDLGLVTEQSDGTAGCTIGTDVSYSSHAFTLIGAVLEDVTGRTAHDLVRTELAQPFGLTTLRSQWATASLPDNYERAVAYDSNNNAAAHRDTSWKVFGGGLEMSAVDLARFGSMLLRGEIIDPVARDSRLWSAFSAGCGASVAGNCSYGIAWDRGLHRSRRIAHHSGNQLGANSHIRIYRDDDLVIAVMSNRDSLLPRDSHDDAADLASAIADIVLGT